jgi:hypothetical protein
MEAQAGNGEITPTPRVERLISLRPCDRCGDVHLKIMFKPFAKRDVGSWTHWALCPTNGEPVLMRFRSEKEKAA